MSKKMIIGLIIGGVAVGVGLYAGEIHAEAVKRAKNAAVDATKDLRVRTAEEEKKLTRLEEISPKVSDIIAKENAEVSELMGSHWGNYDMNNLATKAAYDAQKASITKHIQGQRSIEDAEILAENDELIEFKNEINKREKKIVDEAMDIDGALVEILREEGITKWYLYGLGDVITGGAVYLLFIMWRKIFLFAKRI